MIHDAARVRKRSHDWYAGGVCFAVVVLVALLVGQQQFVSNAYVRPAPQGQDAPDWLELALPSGRYLIHSPECALTPWTEVNYHSSAPNLAGVNDCPLDAWIRQSDTPCATDERGVCDLTLDQSYQDWLHTSEDDQ
jgi:hypothetical protein